MNYVLRRLSLILFIAPFLSAQAAPQSPEEVFGFRPGDDYKLASYEQMETYYRQLAAESDRVLLREIGSAVVDKISLHDLEDELNAFYAWDRSRPK